MDAKLSSSGTVKSPGGDFKGYKESKEYQESKVKPAATDKSDLGLMLFSRRVDLNTSVWKSEFGWCGFLGWSSKGS